MPAFRLCFLEPKYRTIQAKDITDAQKQARMMFEEINEGRDDPAVLTRIEIPEEINPGVPGCNEHGGTPPLLTA